MKKQLGKKKKKGERKQILVWLYVEPQRKIAVSFLFRETFKKSNSIRRVVRHSLYTRSINAMKRAIKHIKVINFFFPFLFLLIDSSMSFDFEKQNN